MEWWQRTHRVADFAAPVWTETTGSESLRTMRELSFDLVSVSPADGRGGQRGAFYFKTRAGDEAQTDYLGPYLEDARDAGVRVIATVNVHWLESGFASRHRDWLQLRPDGSLIDDARAKGAAACPNNPAFRAWAMQAIRDLARYPLDGIALVGPAFLAHGCWCPACATRFQERMGKPLPPRENWEDAAWKEFIAFRYDCVTEFVKETRAAIRKSHAQLLLTSRSPDTEAGWASGRDPIRLAPHQDLLVAEPAPPAVGESLWAASLRTKLLETRAEGRPVMVTLPTVGRWIHTPRGEVETRLAWAEVLANGGWPVYPLRDDAGTRSAGPVSRFAEEQARYLEGTVSTADVAVLWSDRTAAYYHAQVASTEHGGERVTRRQRSGDHPRALVGWLDCLTRRHLPYDVVDERVLDEGLERYRVLILPNVACFSHKHATAITTWVHAGGALISTFETSAYTDWGVRRSTPALRDVLGFDPAAVDGPTECDYFDRGEDPLFGDVEATLLPSPKYRCLVTLGGGSARGLTWYRERVPTPHHPVPPVSRHPAIVDNRWGAGSSLYFAGTIDETYLDHHHPDHGALMAARVEEASHRIVHLDAPGSVQLAVRRQTKGRRLVIHLVNATGEMTRPVTRLTPVDHLRLDLPTAKSVGVLRWITPEAREPKKLTAKEHRKGGWEIALPRLETWALVVIESVSAKT